MRPCQIKPAATDSRLTGEPSKSLRLRHLNRFLAITIILLLTFNASFCFAANEGVGSAEAIIQRLANSKADKTRSALIWGGIGLGYSLLSLLTPLETHSLGWGSSSTDFLKLSYGILGAGFIVYAGTVYYLPSAIEADYENIKTMKTNTFNETLQRANEAEMSLKKRAKEAENERVLNSLFLCAASLVYMPMWVWGVNGSSSGANTMLVAVFWGSLGIYNWLTKTEIEKEADTYFKGKANR